VLFTIIGLIYLLGAHALPARAELLWGKDSTQSLISDEKRKAFQVHDLVTILINEQESASAEAKTDAKKESRWKAIIKEWIRFSRDTGTWKIKEALPDFDPTIDVEGSHEREADAKTERKSKLIAVITAEIVSILPNGNLVIEAKKTREINEEKETITVTGVIRPEDISADNTVRSERIAKLKVTYKGEGSVSDANKRGLLSRILDALWPW
jgi:flagellar L-ring protein precursor FlgH